MDIEAKLLIMKKIIFSILALSLIAGSSCQEQVDIEKEKNAIISVIEEEAEALTNRDYTLWSETWIQDETSINIHIGSGKNHFTYTVGFKELGSRIKNYFEDNPDPIFSKKELANYKFKIYNKGAWAVYEETIYNQEGEVDFVLLITKIFEKVEGEWKVVYTLAVNKSSYEEV